MPGAEHLCPDYQPGHKIDQRDQEEIFLDGLIIGGGGVGMQQWPRKGRA